MIINFSCLKIQARVVKGNAADEAVFLLFGTLPSTKVPLRRLILKKK